MSGAYEELRDEQFVSLTTFRRNGIAVPTAMWFALDGDDVVVSTPAGAGKLKRLRNNPQVTLQACSRRGAPVPGSYVLDGQAHRVPASEVEALLAAKYGWQWRIALRVEQVSSRLRRRGAPLPRVALRITPRTPPEPVGEGDNP